MVRERKKITKGKIFLKNEDRYKKKKTIIVESKAHVGLLQCCVQTVESLFAAKNNQLV